MRAAALSRAGAFEVFTLAVYPCRQLRQWAEARIDGRVRTRRADRNPPALRSPGDTRITEVPMEQRVVESPERARSARKPGVVRYVLAVSLVLVVILFLVAYTISV